MKSSLIKKCVVTVTGIASLCSAATFAAEQQYERAQKELKIMSKIFDTSINESQEKRSRFLSASGSSATYLAKQGMVFSFNFGRNTFQSASDWAAFGEGVGHLVGEIASEVGNAIVDAPLPPMAPESIDLENFYADYEERIAAQEAMRERLSEQREQVRDMQREIRRVEREKQAAASQRQTAEKLRQELEQKLSLLDKKKDEYNKMMKEYREKRDQKYLANSQKKSDTILTTLCDYGATLKSLKNDEFVTIIFKNFEDEKDQVYVFDYDDVKSCDSKEDLMKRAIAYQI